MTNQKLQDLTTKTSALKNTFEERISSLEQSVIELQKTIAKERILLRKAIFLQLDMDAIYEEPL